MNILHRIQEYIYRRQVRRHPRRKTGFPHYDKVGSVLIIYKSDLLERNDQIKQIRDSLLEEGKEVMLLGYAEKKNIASLILPQSRIIGFADINLWGAPKSNVVADIEKRHFDLLIDLSIQPELPLRYMTLIADADFKVGMHQAEEVYHFMIEPTETLTLDSLYKYIHYYLSSIHSND